MQIESVTALTDLMLPPTDKRCESVTAQLKTSLDNAEEKERTEMYIFLWPVVIFLPFWHVSLLEMSTFS